ncbi:hypothetical protein [Acinetobacter baumannii]|nr:hypothetical protein [Acinetobacter baumannii]EXR09021.1 hypothetical protein J673_3317 [Acinetobacter baumannii 1232509]
MVQVSLMANNASKNNTVDINVGQTKNIVVEALLHKPISKGLFHNIIFK